LINEQNELNYGKEFYDENGNLVDPKDFKEGTKYYDFDAKDGSWSSGKEKAYDNFRNTIIREPAESKDNKILQKEK
jgi:hypothetical protein